MTTRILFVCLGNICRSPTAEGVFRALSADLDVQLDSAGTSDWHRGEPPHAPMQQVARARGYDLSQLRARQFTMRDFADFDLILAMDADNLAQIEAQRPAGNRTPVRLMTDFAPESGYDHVPDPYYTGDYDQTLDLVEAASRGLIAYLQ